MEKVFLATTAMKKGWDLTARKIMLVEEGCYRHDFSFENCTVDLECISDGVFSREKLDEYNKEVERVRGKFLIKTGEILNKYYNTHLDKRNWDLMLYYWLDYYVEGIFTKYTRLKTAKRLHDVYVYGLQRDDYKHPYYGSGYYIWSMRDDAYTFQLYTEIAKHMQIEVRKYISLSNVENAIKNFKTQKTCVCEKIQHISNLCSKGAKTIVINPDNYGFTFWDKLYVYLKSLGKTRFINLKNVGLERHEYDKELRKEFTEEIRAIAVSEFEYILAEMIFYDIPMCYLEGYSDLIAFGSKYMGKKTQNIITAEDWHYSEGIKVYIALLRQHGARLCTLITGGQCNITRGRTETEADIRISDILYTSGWEENGCACEYLTNPRFSGCRDKIENINIETDILYAGTAVMGYGFILGNIMSFVTTEYLRNFMFVLKQLSKISNISVKVRMNHAAGDTGWNVEKLILACFGDKILIDKWNHSFHYEVRRCKLLIFDAFETIWLEAYLLEVPFVIIGMEEREYFTEAGEKLINILDEAGIYLRDHRIVASYIENILSDVEKWWKQPKRQQALRYIGEHYGYCARDPKREWKKKFVNINME